MTQLRRRSVHHTTQHVAFSPNGPAVKVTYSDAVVIDTSEARHIYCSGKTGVTGANGEGNDLAAGVRNQLRQTLENIKEVLHNAGASFSDVVRVRVYVAVPITRELLDDIHQVRSEYFSEANLPASTLLGVAGLAREGALIEVDADAVVDISMIAAN